MRVVVADDEALLREGLVHLLTNAGFEVLGTQFRVIFDVGAGGIDWRGGFRNAGA